VSLCSKMVTTFGHSMQTTFQNATRAKVTQLRSEIHLIGGRDLPRHINRCPSYPKKEVLFDHHYQLLKPTTRLSK
jgi:hypothetical protein